MSSLSGVTVTHSSSLDYLVGLKAGATFVWAGQTYDITQLIGFYQLGSENSLGTPTASDQGNWKFVTKNNNSGDVAGWDNNSQAGRMNPGQSMPFDYTTITPSYNYGFHFMYTNVATGGKSTGYFGGAQPAPEPASLFGLGAGILGAFRLRRKNRSAA